MAEGNVFISVDEVAEVKADVDFDIFPEYLRGQIHISEVKENGVYEILINTPPAPAGNNCLSSGDCSTFRSSSCERFYYNTCEIIVINLKLKLPKDKLKDLKIGASNFRISNEESKNLKLNVEKDLSLKTTNGRNFETESFSAKSSNGRIEMSNFKVKKSIVETSNGLVSIKNGEVEEDNSVESTNGRITVENFENGHLHSYSTFRSSNAMMIFDNANFNDVLVHTSNGRVTGTQMSVVTVFEAESTNGSIELQKLKMKSFNTRVKVQTSNGSVNLGLINFAGKFSLNTRNAKSDIVGDHIIFDSENKNKGHIEYGNQQELEVNTSNGKIKVNLL
ncbi:hypothetical protein HK099_006640 [Clydaea vesicula]|uniref:DUF4097 domain-containing protein n=1 Tax=Clydaea vesicula TaxID=447962 RepID=A0AAD5TXY7_9FUNG|nr:hypothetical protein HK099_006640 [Clydaea vesicula]